ncbi:AZIN2 inhibitor, partial [Todus mexicanus]|nr:AZIN2 inhibitor [Todus mexicanus]
MNGYLTESSFMMVEEGFTTRDLLENLLGELCQASEQQAFFVADLGDIVKKHLRFLKALPRVKPYFPVKCNGSEGVIRLLAELGAGFACANKAEIARVQSIGVPADKIFYSSPCKQVAHIKYAASHGVQLMTFDNEVELSKVARSHPRARMLLGIAADSSSSAHPSMAFGTTFKSCRHLLEMAKEQAVEVVGISFHLGSHGLEPQAFTQAVAEAQLAFEVATELGYQMRLLDIGGGFPGTEDTRARFEEVAAVINSALDLYFPEGCGVEIIATPGRYYVTSAFTFAASITAREEVPAEQPGSDGVWDDISLSTSSLCPLNTASDGDSTPSLGSLCQRWATLAETKSFLRSSLNLPRWSFRPFPLVLALLTCEKTHSFPRRSPSVISRCRKTIQLFQGNPPQAEDERESVCAPLSCGWELAEPLRVPPLFAPAGII